MAVGPTKKEIRLCGQQMRGCRKPAVFKTLDRQCARFGLEQARAQTIELARCGEIEAVLSNLEHVCRYAEEAEDKHFSADGFRRECLYAPGRARIGKAS